MEYVKCFMELEVYKVARDLAKLIFEVTKNFPKDEQYSLTSQIRKSSRSIGAQIAEAWGKRNYEKHFISKLTDADAEQLETQHWIETALDCKYLCKDIACQLLVKCRALGKMLNKMIEKSEAFCSIRPK